ncbi:MAG: hypothetical protein ACOZIN_20410 [Myxococcota bacterium]
MNKHLAAVVMAALAGGCAHKQLSGADLDRVVQPAVVSRIEEGAGPRSFVFRQDGSYSGKLKKLEPKEADRRLMVKLSQGMSRFEISDGLRAKVLALLPKEAPWTQTTDPVAVARELQSFLVEEVPANPPDYQLLAPLGADAVLELVIEEFGMRSAGGRAGTYIEGYGRMFFLVDGREVWRRAFRVDQVDAHNPHVDPFRVAKDPAMFRTELTTLLDAVATQFAKDLNPPDRRQGPAMHAGTEKESSPTAPEKNAPPEVNDGELPDPDPL